MSGALTDTVDIHRPTVLAIALFAYVSASLVHEVLGHGGMCLALGARLMAVSTAWCDCDRQALSIWIGRSIAAGGTLANLFVGTAAAAALHRLGDRGATSYALWLLAAVNLAMAAGYLLTDPIFGFGDWTRFVEGLSHPGLWKVGLVVCGVVIEVLAIGFLLPWLGSGTQRMRNGLTLALLPWVVVGCIIKPAAATLNIYGLQYAFTSALASVGGTSLLAWCYTLPWRRQVDRPVLRVPRSLPWLIAGAVSLILTILLGRGVVFSAD